MAKIARDGARAVLTIPSLELEDATAMSTPLELMRWRVMPRPVKNGNAQFQRMSEDVFRDLDCRDPFMDDIIISRGTPDMTDGELIEAHFVDLRKVLKVLCKH